MSKKFFRRFSSLSLGDIGRYGNCGSLNLTSKSERFLLRKTGGDSINVANQFHCLLPCDQLSVMLEAYIY